MKPYIIVFGYDIGSRKDIQDFIDTIEEVDYWLAFLPNCVFCTSSLDAPQIANKIKDYFGIKQFLVMECHQNRQGWLPRRAWEMMRSPERFSSTDPGESSRKPYKK